MHKPSERCRPPHLHRDTLRNKLFLTPAVHSVHTSEELYAMLMRANGRLAKLPTASWSDKVRGKPLQKAREHGLYLGVSGDYAWLDTLGS